ncbi:MAG TPA: phosphohistidine phosphatase SixA [Gaiellales bacterium]|jgi:phosphohistidine phosphatase|nr:phosphohistidine phosphatase SixA [Gaiellales bacterium]
MRLLVFRHGIAEDTAADGTDAARVLTAEGVTRTRKAARALARLCDAPDVILTSPKARARQTADAAAAAFGSTVEVLDELADGPPEPALCALARRAEETVMIVGHEPMLSALVEQVCTGSRTRGFVDLRKAGCACLDVTFRPGGEVMEATLLWLATAKMLRAAAPG